MSTESGIKMQGAIAAVCRMHNEVSKLLLEFDRLVPWPSVSIFGNYATRDLTYNVRAPFWMPEGVYRYLSCKEQPTLVEGMTVCFVSPRLKEPVLLLGRIHYRESQGDMRSVCDCWDLWGVFFDWNSDWEPGVPKICKVRDSDRIRSARVVYVPLYSIACMDDVQKYLNALRSEDVAQNAAASGRT